MKKYLALALFLSSATFAHAQTPFKIISVQPEKMTTKHLCTKLGGEGQPITVKITHTKTEGVNLTVYMQDTVSNGRLIDHKRTKVTSNKSGSTTLTYAFIPPCNTLPAGITSNYSFGVEAEGQSKEALFGRYDTATKRIYR
jgi:hypothetical protein